MSSADLDEILRRHHADPKKLPVILQELQAAQGRIHARDIAQIAGSMNIPIGDAFTFASPIVMKGRAPRAKNILTICLGRNCAEAGGFKLLEAAIESLGIEPGETTNDGDFTLDTVVCMGYCDKSKPNLTVNDKVYQGVSVERLGAIILEARTT